MVQRALQDLIEMDLGVEGREFVESELRGGWASLSKLLLQSLDLSTGKVVTYLPAGTSVAAAKDFKIGGKLPTPPESTWVKVPGGIAIPTPNTLQFMADLLDSALSASDSVFILEDAIASRSDPGLERTSSRTAFLGDEVYHVVVGGPPSSASTIKATVRSAESFRLVGAVSSLSRQDPPLPPNRGELTLELLEQIALRTTTIMVGAYDFEGYVLWCRGEEG